MAESNFVDYVKIYCRSGKGGRGSAHMRRAKYVPNGGPDGGNGGRGGNVYLRGNRNYWTLLHLRYDRHVFAGHGGNGSKARSSGKDGEDKYIDVPCGTVVYNAETGEYLCDVTEDGQVVLLLKGGRGGLGNWNFRTATNQAPRYAQPGEPMQEIIPGTTDGALEKHVPVIEVEGNKVTVRVGAVEHPMLPEHYIEWIALETAQGNQRKPLAPGQKPEAVFMLAEGDSVVAAYEYCNLHSLWKA